MKTSMLPKQSAVVILQAVAWMLCSLIPITSQAAATLRPPSVPLVACDPYFSIWSPADKLTEADTVHWTGKPHRLTSQVRIDGKAFRVMGKDPGTDPALPQTGLEVLPTRTIYTFEGEGVRLTLTFMTAALPEDLMIYSRPLTYVTWEFRAIDGKKHEALLNFGASAEVAVNEPQQEVTVSRQDMGRLTAVKLGSKDQPILAKKGDDLRIDWGHLYIAAPISEAAAWTVIPESASEAVKAQAAMATVSFDTFKFGTRPVSRWLMLAYDDEYSIQYFKKNLRPYWRRNGDDAAALLKKAATEYASLQKRCAKFDTEMMAALTKAGGEKYARICALAYRQSYAANKVVADANGQALMFPKENFSNGCIGTVDVIYPMAPQFLLFSPSLTKAMLVPIMDYAASPRWRWPFAPHDLGTYPLANGQVYGGGERTEEDQMPVEESGNMLILLGALAHVEGNADFALHYWPQLVRWAEYLREKGLDPENQLSTDDFAGHLAHNTNLSIKAILGLRAFAEIARLGGHTGDATRYETIARDMATQWPRMAADGDHYRLAFDKPGTWSQKYNLVWDRVLGYHLFAPEIARTEVAFYLTKLNTYGLPLDNRKTYTKLDWTVWTSCLAEKDADFRRLIAPSYRWMNETPTRVPLTDWYETTNGKQVGFQARSVVGGLFIPLLRDPELWRKWSSRGIAKANADVSR